MTSPLARAVRVSSGSGSVEFDADVLVLGGGPAGTWAAISAAERGARVVLADKGFCGNIRCYRRRRHGGLVCRPQSRETRSRDD